MTDTITRVATCTTTVENRIPAPDPTGVDWTQLYKAMALIREEVTNVGRAHNGLVPADEIRVISRDASIIVAYNLTTVDTSEDVALPGEQQDTPASNRYQIAGLEEGEDGDG